MNVFDYKCYTQTEVKFQIGYKKIAVIVWLKQYFVHLFDMSKHYLPEVGLLPHKVWSYYSSSLWLVSIIH